MPDYTQKVKTRHRKAVQSSLRAKIHTIVKKKVKESGGKRHITLKKKKIHNLHTVLWFNPTNYSVLCFLLWSFKKKKTKKRFCLILHNLL